MRIAMWSGPRNLSTAMMYSFGARDDCAVWDEPFYAAYLVATGLNHPMRTETLRAGEQNPDRVAARCTAPVPNGKPVFYQKHMCHHMLPGFPQGWMADMTHVFLIRDPARVIASYHAKRENPTLEDIGFRQQAALFATLCNSGATPVVIDSDDIKRAPEPALIALCAAIELPYSAKMLHWPKGGHPDDGPWAPHWYGAVRQSCGFATNAAAPPVLSKAAAILRDAAQPYFDRLAIHKLAV